MLGLQTEAELDAFVLQCCKGYAGIDDNKIPNQEPFNVPIDLQT